MRHQGSLHLIHSKIQWTKTREPCDCYKTFDESGLCGYSTTTIGALVCNMIAFHIVINNSNDTISPITMMLLNINHKLSSLNPSSDESFFGKMVRHCLYITRSKNMNWCNHNFLVYLMLKSGKWRPSNLSLYIICVPGITCVYYAGHKRMIDKPPSGVIRCRLK